MTNPNPEKTLGRALLFTTKGNNKNIRYVLSNEDYLALLQAVEFEGEPRDGVAWTLLQRFAYIYPTYHSLASFVRAYAQPINPAWFPDGARHNQWMAKLAKAGRYDEVDDEKRRAQNRLKYAATPLENISAKSKEVVDTVFELNASPVPGSVHYRAPTVRTTDADVARKARAQFASTNQLPQTIDYGNITTNNWFFGVSGSMSFRIRAFLAEIAAVGRIVLFMLYVGGAGTMIYQLWKHSNHAA